MSPYRIAPAAPTPPPKRSAVVRLWRMGRRLDPVTAMVMPVVGTLTSIVAAIVVGLLANDIAHGFAAGYTVFLLVPPFYLLRGYLRLRRVRAALAPCPTHRAMGKHGRCGNVTCCNDCSQAWAAEGFTRYPAITEARERLPPPRANAEQAKPREQAQATVTTTTRTHYRIRVRTIVR